MDLTSFLNCIEQGIIPDSAPDGLEPGGWGLRRFDLGYFEARDICISYGMWAIVDKRWTRALAEWIGDRKVLEIMAGAGWLAKALNDYGVGITATDDYSWDNRHSKAKRVYPVKCAHCLEAISKYPADILICSWPPYGEDAITAAARLWGPEKPIIMIGESRGGCNAPDDFWAGYEAEPADFPMVSWDGIHDFVHIGYFREERNGRE